MIDRRHFLQAGAGLASFSLTGALAGCGGNQGLRLIGEASSNLAAIRTLLPEFKARTGIEVIAEEVDFNTLETQTTSDFRANRGRYDIILQYNFSLSPYVRNNYISKIAELKWAAPEADYTFEQDILPNVWRELGFYAQPPFNSYEKVEPVAYPFAANTMVLVYNKRILAQPAVAQALQRTFRRPFTVPRTWEELARATGVIREASPGTYGIALQGAGGGWLYYEWVNFLFGMGGRVMNKEYGWQSDASTPLTLQSPEADRAAALYLSMRDANAGDFFSIDAAKQRDLMLERNVAYSIMWTDYVPDLVTEDDIFGFAPVPGDLSMIAGGCFFVNRRTANLVACANLIAFLLKRSSQKRMAMRGLFPPTRPALYDGEVGTKPYISAVRESLARGVYMAEAGTDSTIIEQEITAALQRAWRRVIAPDQVATVATAAIARRRNT